jgi:hypothetical protein
VIRRLKVQIKSTMNAMGFSVAFSDELTKIANRYLSDKGNLHFSRHHYTRWYDHYFGNRRSRTESLLEIGLCRVDYDGRRLSNVGQSNSKLKASDVPSLKMWRDYFPNAMIFGADIDDFTDIKLDRIFIHQFDAGNIESLTQFVYTINERFDIIIDDASHLSEHQQVAFSILFPLLRSGGIYVIEDLHAEYDVALSSDSCSKQFLRRLAFSKKISSPWIDEDLSRDLENDILQVRLCDSWERADDEHQDAIAFIFKR